MKTIRKRKSPKSGGSPLTFRANEGSERIIDELKRVYSEKGMDWNQSAVINTAIVLHGKTPLPKQFKRRLIHRLRTLLSLNVWHKDITRHSAASYWLAIKPDAGFVAEQLGNSEKVLKRDYRALVTKEQAKAFWASTGD